MADRTAVFLLSKDPENDHGGDVTLSRALVRLAREVTAVRVICLSRTDGSTDGVLRVRKPAVQTPSLVWQSLRTRRSLIHTRFDLPQLRAAVESTHADVYVTDHSYMAESYLASGRRATGRLVVTTGVSEADVWRATRHLALAPEALRLARDEVRVARAANIVGTFDAEEAVRYRAAGIRDARWLDVTLAPGKKLDLTHSGPRLVFMGSRDWRPNAEALDVLLDAWPKISHGIPGAELTIIGPGSSDGRMLSDGVVDGGFVSDLPAFLSTCRGLVAPIVTGGGVRVKMLEAASHGLPVIGTSAALGSHGGLLGLAPRDASEEFIAGCRLLLMDRSAAVTAGAEIHARNAERWHSGIPHRAVEGLVT
ncbi:glycosyltransferase [Smaragdicoccus niigatensis]|uniref:glycosyltransferase n=1 Tax=Smaragdicoccus niigatensis TaxID=359359 RepID=UPI000368FA28|nr:glycosyltransferase [Smaragdicoccus niigatensis]